ncbi:MAG: hypothetical protein DCC64_15855 [Planctomycetota bacterium]|nr:MAG: hypothetical protein DCC64_15855 [Planctomycetota bacterium]
MHQFSEADRQRIRSALQRYMRDHKIGVPTLRERICKATGRIRNTPSGDDPYLVPQKTLQRFLAGSHRTQDLVLVPIAEFAKSLPARNVVEELAAAASGFFSQSDPSEAKGSRASAAIAGKYDLLAMHVVKADNASGLDLSLNQGYKVECGQAEFISTPSGLTVREVITNPHQIHPAPQETDGPRITWEGVVCAMDTLVLLIMRNEAVFVPAGAPKSPYVVSDRFRFRPTTE